MAYLDHGLFNRFASIDGHFAERAGEPAGRIKFLVQKVSVLNVSGRHAGMHARLKDVNPLASTDGHVAEQAGEPAGGLYSWSRKLVY